MADASSFIVSSEAAGCFIRDREYDVASAGDRPDAASGYTVASEDPGSAVFGALARYQASELNGYDFSGPTGNCSRGSTRRFSVIFDHSECTVTVRVRINLQPDSGVSVSADKRDSWVERIEHAWSDYFKLVRTDGPAPCAEYRILVEVLWTATNPHYNVTVRAGKGRPRMTTWYLGMKDKKVAHEFGHMLGNVDEYDGTCDGCPDRPVHRGLMASEYDYDHPFPRHYYLVERFVGQQLCSAFEVETIGPPEWRARGGGMDYTEWRNFWHSNLPGLFC